MSHTVIISGVSWLVRPEVSGGGVMLENGSHSVDLFRHLCGEVVSATARTRTVTTDMPATIIG